MKSKKNTRIFVVDDQPVFFKVLGGLLSKYGFEEIYNFERPDDCLSNLNLYPDIIFMDYNMDSMDGISLLKKVKDFNNDIAVIFTTGMEDIKVAMEAMKYGAFDFLLKSNISKKELGSLFDKLAIVGVTDNAEERNMQGSSGLSLSF